MVNVTVLDSVVETSLGLVYVRNLEKFGEVDWRHPKI